MVTRRAFRTLPAAFGSLYKMPSAPPLRVLLIGAGVMGSHHGRVIAQSEMTKLAAIIDPDADRAQRLADRFGCPSAAGVDDFRDYDAIVVASPTDTHVEWAEQALASGVPTLIEKPVAEEPGDVRRLIEMARRSNTVLMCGFLERFNPAVMTAMDVVQAPVHILTTRHSPFEPRIKTGVAFDLLIHDVDLLLRMASSDVTTITAQYSRAHPTSEGAGEDIAELTVRFDGGLLASLSASRVSQRKVRAIEIAELGQLIEVDLLRQDVTVYRHVGAELIESDRIGYRQQTIVDIPVIPYRHEPLGAQLEHFVGLVHGERDVEAERASFLAPHEILATAAEYARELERGAY